MVILSKICIVVTPLERSNFVARNRNLNITSIMRQILMILIVMLLTCCSSENGVRANTNQAQSNIGKTLIVFYSYTGNCREIASSLAGKITADQLEILPAEKGLLYDADNYALGTQLFKTFVNAGGGNVNVTISLTDTTSGISMVRADEMKSNAFTMQGMSVQDGTKGVVIQKGKKIIR